MVKQVSYYFESIEQCGPGAGMDPATKTRPSQTRWMKPVMGRQPSHKTWDGSIQR